MEDECTILDELNEIPYTPEINSLDVSFERSLDLTSDIFYTGNGYF